MSPQYGKLRPTNGWDLFGSLGHPSKFQPVSRLDFVTATTSLNGGQQNLAGCLAVSWAGTLSTHFWRLLPLTEFCQLQNSLCAQVLRYPILAALLHDTRAAAVSQTLWRGTRNWITEFSQRAPPVFGWAAITLGIGPHSSSVYISMSEVASKLSAVKLTTINASVIFYSAQLHCKRCISYGNSVRLSVCLSVRPSVTRRYCVKKTARSTM